MTTHDEALILGVMTRLIDYIETNVKCVGDTLNDYALENVHKLDDEQKKGITHIINHCLEIMELTTSVENYVESKLNEFNREFPGEMLSIKAMLDESDISHELDAIKDKTMKERVLEVVQKLAAEAIHKNNTNLN